MGRPKNGEATAADAYQMFSLMMYAYAFLTDPDLMADAMAAKRLADRGYLTEDAPGVVVNG